MNTIEEFIDEMGRDLRESEEKEIPSTVVGEKIMAKLHELDDVAYVRFASVYRRFTDVERMAEEIDALREHKRREEELKNQMPLPLR